MNALKALLQIQACERSAVGDEALMGENRRARSVIKGHGSSLPQCRAL